jgi:MFS family permease
MGVRRDLLLRFLLLCGMLYCSFGLSSPFLPAFLASRGIGSEWLGFLLGGGTAVRLLSAFFAGRLADVFGAFRLELALFAIAAAVASLLYLPAHHFWLLALVNLTQAAMLAPLVPLADALALSWSRSTTRGNSGAFEYGWVRGMGSAAFIAGVLMGGQSAAMWGLPSVQPPSGFSPWRMKTIVSTAFSVCPASPPKRGTGHNKAETTAVLTSTLKVKLRIKLVNSGRSLSVQLRDYNSRPLSAPYTARFRTALSCALRRQPNLSNGAPATLWRFVDRTYHLS